LIPQLNLNSQIELQSTQSPQFKTRPLQIYPSQFQILLLSPTVIKMAVEEFSKNTPPLQSPLFVPGEDTEMETQASVPDTIGVDASSQKQLRRLLDSTNPEQLERGVEKVKMFLLALLAYIRQMPGLEKGTRENWIRII
jgi:hypothetical protein